MFVVFKTPKMQRQKVAYIYSENLQKHCDRLPTMLNRASIVQDLIESYNLLKHPNLMVVHSEDASEDDLKLFHSSNYIEFLQKTNNSRDLDEFEEEQSEFGLGYDCPILERNYDFVKSIAGGSLSAAKLLLGNKCDIAINWFGGWHHAQRDEASGFCYINDIVLAIQAMNMKFKRIMYLDLDIHHGDGVQNAFEVSKNILTLSFHKFSPGFFPGTGSLQDIGSSKGKYHSINIPYQHGISSQNFLQLFFGITPKIIDAFKPDALVIQCGADTIHGDQVGETNLTLETIGKCVQYILEKTKVPKLFLGGGGYNFPNTARLWTFITSIILEIELKNDIPDESEFFTLYGPTFELHIDGGREKDHNSQEYLNMITKKVLLYCVEICL